MKTGESRRDKINAAMAGVTANLTKLLKADVRRRYPPDSEIAAALCDALDLSEERLEQLIELEQENTRLRELLAACQEGRG